MWPCLYLHPRSISNIWKSSPKIIFTLPFHKSWPKYLILSSGKLVKVQLLVTFAGLHRRNSLYFVYTPMPHVILSAQMDGSSEKVYSTTFRPLQRIAQESLEQQINIYELGVLWRRNERFSNNFTKQIIHMFFLFLFLFVVRLCETDLARQQKNTWIEVADWQQEGTWNYSEIFLISQCRNEYLELQNE